MSSPIEKLKEQIQKSLVFDFEASINAAFGASECVDEIDRVREAEMFDKGARWQHEKSAKMASQLLEVIEILEKYADEWPTRTLMFNNVPFEVPGFGSPTNQIAREFLAKLSKGSEK